MKVFVTGATGFIGANLVVKLLKKGYSVKAFIRKGSFHPFLKGLNVEFCEGDICDEQALEKNIKGCDFVINCAGLVSYSIKDKDNLFKINQESVKKLSQICLKLKIKKLVHISSIAVFKVTNSPIMLSEKSACSFLKNDNYAKSKYGGELAINDDVKKGLNAVIVRPSAVFGEGDLRGFACKLIALFTKYPIFFAPSGGTNVICISDLTDGIIKALENAKIGEIYNLTGTNLSYEELFEKINSVVKGNKKQIIVLPKLVYYLANAILNILNFKEFKKSRLLLKYLFNYRYVDNSKAIEQLNWAPNCDIDLAISKAAQFYKMHSKNPQSL